LKFYSNKVIGIKRDKTTS